MQAIDYFEKIRPLIYSKIEGLNRKQLLVVPKKFNNNIWWNIAHLVVVQESLHYVRTSLEADISSEEVKRYSKGSRPAQWSEPPSEEEIAKIKKKFLEQPKVLRRHYEAGEFKNIEYKKYMTSTGIELTSIEGAIEFNNFHEGLHLGAIMALIHLID